MTEVTLQAVLAKQAEIADMITKLQQQDQPRLYLIAETEIQLLPGEHYAGIVLNENGDIAHHLVLMGQRPVDELDWEDAMAWAQSIGGSLPNRQEQALLFANCKQHIKPAWHWSSQEHEGDASYAWYCYFSYGYQDVNHKSAEGAAVAVRRVNP